MSEVSNYVVVTRGLRKNMQAVYELTLLLFSWGRKQKNRAFCYFCNSFQKLPVCAQCGK